MNSQEYAEYLFNLKDKKSNRRVNSKFKLDKYCVNNPISIVEYMNINGKFTQVLIVK